MAASNHEHSTACARQASWIWYFIAFASMAVLLLWQEHRAHVLGVIPYLILLSCPLIHLFMHRGHRHGGGHQGDGHA